MSNHKTIVALLTTLAVVLATSLCTTNDAFAQPSTQSGSADPEKLFADASALAEQGKLKPHVDSVYPLEKAGDAHAHIQARKNVGKVLLSCE